MKIHRTFLDLGAEKQAKNHYTVKTKTGNIEVKLDTRNMHLTCNFVGSEEKAKEKFGHWKQNTFIVKEQDIINHIERLKQ